MRVLLSGASGFVGRHLFHGIIDTHVIHHLFP